MFRREPPTVVVHTNHYYILEQNLNFKINFLYVNVYFVNIYNFLLSFFCEIIWWELSSEDCVATMKVVIDSGKHKNNIHERDLPIKA